MRDRWPLHRRHSFTRKEGLGENPERGDVAHPGDAGRIRPGALS